ncbi:MAG: acylneuraminate cytidylyltransferase family protein [Sedimenticola thiotaurini]|uniref:Acylneuraminate cytidylyltransferase family protein n=1 Tax=Sedimenticola thiotaurini TaxID=1543721 RepID=A0A558DAQ7_9GAMM|nr:MAG: acylneuraminate cytidylyltransferase family protein [Sedimenticola thiotaurini]
MDGLVSHIAVILARGGSKRLPRKNILEFHGKPLIAWTIEAARESGHYQRVLVSTDDPEIAEISRTFGADVPFLRDSAADDISPSSEATIVALGQAERHWGERYQFVSQLMANCPLRGAPDIEDAVNHFMGSGADSQISCFRFGWMNPWWAAKLDDQGYPEHLFPEARLARSQDLPPLYCPSGAIWIAKVDALRSKGTFYGDDYLFHPMGWMSAMDIDDAEDLDMARACFLARGRQDTC